MDRAEQNVATTVTFTFSVDGAATDPAPATATVTVKRSGGTVLYSDAATTHGGAGEFSYKLLPADTAQLGVLDLAWKATLDGVEQVFHTKVEIVGGFYFTIAEFVARYPDVLDDHSPSEIAEARATAEDIIEGLDDDDDEGGCHRAFVPRFERRTLSGDGTTRISIPRYHLREILSCSVGGAVVSPASLAIEASSVYSRTWKRGFSNVLLGYVHGMDAPPRQIKDAAILLAYHRLVKGPIDDRATGISTDGGVITLATPGRGGWNTGIPEVDKAIVRYRLPLLKPASISLGERGHDYPPAQIL